MLQDAPKIPSTIKAATLKELLEDQPKEKLSVSNLIQTSTLPPKHIFVGLCVSLIVDMNLKIHVP